MDEIQKPNTKSAEIDFLRAELNTGFTLSKIALGTTDQGKRTRNRENARKAYDAVLRFLPGTDLEPDEKAKIKSTLEQLKFDLQLLGEKI